MKIKENKIKTKQLLQLHMIKSRVYGQKGENFLSNLPAVDVSKIIIKLKKSIQIIFKFHKNKKKILFIGVPKIIETKINLETNHVALPKFFNIFGLFINKSVLKSLRLKYQIINNKNRISFLKLTHKPDLIVVFNYDHTDSIMKESYRSKIPLIHFNSDFYNKKKDKFYSYNVPGNYNFNTKAIDNLFFKMINSILNK